MPLRSTLWIIARETPEWSERSLSDHPRNSRSVRTRDYPGQHEIV